MRKAEVETAGHPKNAGPRSQAGKKAPNMSKEGAPSCAQPHSITGNAKMQTLLLLFECPVTETGILERRAGGAGRHTAATFITTPCRTTGPSLCAGTGCVGSN